VFPTEATEVTEATEATEASQGTNSTTTPTLEAAAKTPCGHIFHASCLEPWIGKWRDQIPTLIKPNPPTCPYCRSTLTAERKEKHLKGYTPDQIFKNILSIGVWNLDADAQGKPFFWFVTSVGTHVLWEMYFEEVDDAVQDAEGEEREAKDEDNDHDEKEAENEEEDSDVENEEEDKDMENENEEKGEVEDA
jgi:hypothetical protein